MTDTLEIITEIAQEKNLLYIFKSELSAQDYSSEEKQIFDVIYGCEKKLVAVYSALKYVAGKIANYCSEKPFVYDWTDKELDFSGRGSCLSEHKQIECHIVDSPRGYDVASGYLVSVWLLESLREKKASVVNTTTGQSVERYQDSLPILLLKIGRETRTRKYVIEKKRSLIGVKKEVISEQYLSSDITMHSINISPKFRGIRGIKYTRGMDGVVPLYYQSIVPMYYQSIKPYEFAEQLAKDLYHRENTAARKNAEFAIRLFENLPRIIAERILQESDVKKIARGGFEPPTCGL